MKKIPTGRFFNAVSALLVVLVLGLGATHEGWVNQRKRTDRFSQRPARTLRVKMPALRRSLRRYASDRVLVRFRPGVTDAYAEGLLRSYGFSSVHQIPRIGVYSVRTSPGVSVPETLAMLRRNGDIERARPDYLTRLADIPNDPFLPMFQYNLRNRGMVLEISDTIHPQTTAGADIKATAAWDQTHGDPGLIIAVLDTGVDRTHPELSAKVVSAGHDFVNDDEDATDDFWHGTLVAGIAAADTNNSVGIAGVARDCRILPVKVSGADGTGNYSWLIEGIVWATDQGAKVINLSLGGDVDDPDLEDACKYAFDRGVVIAASVGNDSGSVLYPAAYDDYVLAVAATDYNDERTDYSNFGPQVDVAAPGQWIMGPIPLLVTPEGYIPYAFGEGTSFAAPHVSGMAALIFSLKPELKPADVMAVVRYTADDVNKTAHPGRDDFIGYGRINMQRALAPYILK